MQAIVLAGGLGVKLRPLTFTIPKPLLPLVNKPQLDFVLYILKEAGITSILVVTDHLSQSLANYLSNYDHFGIPITLVPLKHYHGSAQILVEIQDQLEDSFLVVNSDCIFDIKLQPLLQMWQQSDLMGAVILHRIPDVMGKGWFLAKKSAVEHVIESHHTPPPEAMFDCRIYYLKKAALSVIASDKPMEIHLAFLKSIVEAGMPLGYYVHEGFWAILGRVHTYMATNFWMIQNIGNPAYIGANASIHPKARLTPPYFIDEDCRIDAGAVLGPNVIIGRNSVIGPNTRMDNTILHADVTIGSESVLSHSIVSYASRLGNKVETHALSIVGPDCEIGDQCILEPGARVGPGMTIEKGTWIRDLKFPMGLAMRGMHARIINWFEVPDLTLTEQMICQILQQSGEKTLSGISDSLKRPESELEEIITDLMSRNIVISYGDSPRIYSLMREI